MPETINSKRVFSLAEVTLSIQRTIAERYRTPFWVKAEMNKLNHYSHSGHCYPELVEKKDGKVVALLKSNLWKSDFERINQHFINVLKEPLKDGINILFCASISFDPSHGLSLRILDIDPSFSLGELEREKQETLERLKQEGVFTLNKRLHLPLLPQRIAVISVETSKGYSDFIKVIEQNPWNFKFSKFLFPSLLQGDRSVTSICNQLKRIKKIRHHFDVVAIIRGGGGDVGLSSYNHYELAKEIALFPIPVLTGIGHSTNETVAEMVSFKNAITPTELADFLIQKFHDFAHPLRKFEETIVYRSKRITVDEQLKLRNLIKYFRSVTSVPLSKSHADIRRHSESILQHSRFLLKRKKELLEENIILLGTESKLYLDAGKTSLDFLIEKIKNSPLFCINKELEKLQAIEKNVNILDPVNILKRGFAIALLNGKPLKSYNEAKPGDPITILLADGKIDGEVRNSLKPDQS